MEKEIKYLLDANVFIAASKTYYAFDIAPRFWKCLEQLAIDGRACSIDRVLDELKDQRDALSDWASKTYTAAFCNTRDDVEVLDAYRNLQNWAQGQELFTSAAKHEFAQCADAWLIAFAIAKDYTIVTHEVHSPGIKWKIKIPNACLPFGVRSVNTFIMLRELGVKIG